MHIVGNGCCKQIKGALFAGLLLILAHGSVYAHSYFVSPSGNDSYDGSSPDSAWLSLDRGDQLALLTPGDVINVLPGTYTYTRTMTLSTSGTAASPIVYRRLGEGEAVIDADNLNVDVVSLAGNHVIIDGLTLTNSQDNGILVSADSCEIICCGIHHLGHDGIRLEGQDCLIQGNTLHSISGHGVQLRATALSGYVHNNTIYGCVGNGIEFQANSASARIFNNVIVGNDYGIRGKAENICAFNDVWDNASGGYAGGAVDSTGGLDVDPMFVDSASGDFRLQLESPVIDAGLDLGFPFNGSAPDMGAHEFDSTSVEGMIIWRTGAALSPKYSLWYGSTFGAAGTADSIGVITTMHGAMSRSRNEAIMLGVDQDREIGGQMWDGNVWTAFASNDLATVSESGRSSFGVAYERVSGDALIVWDNGTSGGASISHSVWNGTAWAGGTTLPVPLVGEPKHMCLAASPTTDEMVLVVSNEDSQDYAVVWNGSAWGNTQVTSLTGAGDNLVDISVAYEQQSGHAIAVNGDNSNYVFFSQWNGTTWAAEDSLAPPAGATGTVLFTTMASDPTSDRIVLGVLTTAASVWFSIWDGSGWTPPVLSAFAASGVNYSAVAVAFEGLSGNALACYSGATLVHCLTWSPGGGWVASGTGVDPSATPTTITLTPEPESNRIMLTILDNAHDLGTILWDGSFWSLGAELETAVGVGDGRPFAFLWTGFDNHAPVLAAIGPRTTTEEVLLSIAVSATDAESTPTLTTSALPSGAAFNDYGDGTGELSWTPTTSQAGVYTVTFYATDDAASVDSEVVVITVDEAVNQPPSMHLIPTRLMDEGSTVNQAVVATDAESIPVLTSSALPSGATFTDSGTGTGLFHWVPSYTQAGSYSITFYATDDSSAVDSSVFSLTVNEVGNQVPILAAIGAKSVAEGDALAFRTAATDGESTPSLTCSTLPSGAGYVDSGNGAGSFSWTPSGLQAGSYHVTFYATDDSAAVDSEVVSITVTAAPLDYLTIAPDSVTVSADSTLSFSVVGYDTEGYERDPGDLTWSLVGALGTIDSTGLFDATTVGVGKVVVRSSLGPVDTSAYLHVIAGRLVALQVEPDSVIVGLGDSVQFTVEAYDEDGNNADYGTVSWRALGRIGRTDSSGLFIANRPGSGKVAAISSVGGIADTSAALDVDELYVSTAAIGTGAVHPGDSAAPALVLRIDNYYAEDKTITGLTIRDASHGAGNLAQVLSNIDSAMVYVDKDDDSLLSPGDSLIARNEYTAATTMAFAPVTIPAEDGQTFLVTLDVSSLARDGDSLDVFIRPAVDVTTGDGTIAAGADSANSLGYCVVDGLVAAQVGLTAVGAVTVEPGDSLYHLLTVDLPRNGYQVDTLRAFSVGNAGTASVDDVDSLVLYRDAVDGVWNGPTEETRLGRLVYTGDKWTLSGLSIALADPLTRFYVAGSPSVYPTNGRTLAFGIPVNGVEMASQNDGPIDRAVEPVDTFEIQTNEQLTLSAEVLPVGTLVPGDVSASVLALSVVNSYASAVGIDSLRVTVTLTDPDGATQQQLESQIDSVLLYVDLDGNYASTSAPDTLLAAGSIVAGEVVFATEGIPVEGSGGALHLLAVVAMNVDSAKDGNTVNLSVAQVSDVFADPPGTIVGSFPLQSGSGFTVTSFAAAQVELVATGTTVLYGGQTKRPVLDFRLPGHGYAADRLSSIRIDDGGSLGNTATLLTIKLWRNDDGHGADLPANFLGQFTPDVSEWVLDGLSDSVPSGGARFLVTADVADRQFDGGGVQFSIPIGGVLYESGMDGPDDLAVTNTESPLVFASDRITAISIPAGSSVAAPGTADQSLLTFALYNGYVGETQSLRSVTFTNISRTASGQAFVDGELGQVSLLFDQNNDRLPGGDPLVATGHFSGGRLRLGGMDVVLPAESLSYFFVLGNVAQQSIDADSLAIAISGMSDLEFGAVVNLNGDVPLASGGYVVVNGSVAAQYSVPPLASRTLTPGDTSVVLFAFTPAVNGDQIDRLESVRMVNLGDATPADVKALGLWLDTNDDGQWQASDSMLGAFGYVGGGWTAGGLDLDVQSSAPTLFVVGDIDSTATSGAVFMAQVPVDGCAYASGNDGPRDHPVVATSEFTVSTSPLRVAQSIARETYSVGQTVVVHLTATNLSASTISNVSGEVVSVDNPTLVLLDSSQTGPVSLATGQSADFVYYYTAQDAGSVTWQVRAVAPLEPDSSVTVRTRAIQIQTVPQQAVVQLTSAIPTAVTRGLANVFPLSLRVVHPDTAHTAAALRLDSLRLDVLDGSGAPLSATAVFSRLALSTGYASLTVLDNVPSQSSVTLQFDEPLIVSPGNHQNIALLVDISPDASASSFALAVSNASAVALADNNTLVPVTISPSVTFPLRTESCRIDDPSDLLAVSAVSLLGATANLGQSGVSVVQLKLRHPGLPGSSQIQVSAVRFRFVDEAQQPITIASLFDSVTLVQEQLVVGAADGSTVLSDEMTLPLSSPLNLNPGGVDSVRIVVSLLPTSTYTNFGLIVDDSTCLSVRDISSGSLVLATTDTLSLATGSVFPITTGTATLKHAAIGPTLCCADLGGSSVVGGANAVPLAELLFAYAVDSTYSAVRLNGVQMAVFDEQGLPLNADLLFDKIGVSISNEPVTYQASIGMTNGLVSVEFGPNGVPLGPGDTVTVRLIGDIEGDAPYETFRLGIQSSSLVLVHDATDSLRALSAEPLPDCEQDMPFSTSVTRIFLPAGRPVLTTESIPAQIVSVGQTDVTTLRCALAYTGSASRGDITIDGLTAQVSRRTANGTAVVTAGDVFSAVRLVLDDSVVAEVSDLTQESFTLTPATTPVLTMGETMTIGIVGDIRTDAVCGNYFVRLADSSSLSLSDANLATSVFVAVQGVTYPLTSAELSVNAAGLEQSFTSYPNPFNPSAGEQATIGYVLVEPAQVDIELFSISGEAVKVVANDAYRAAGSHQDDAWTGTNDAGLDVAPGTYLCRITARYQSGTTETFRRKVTVIR